MLQTSAKLTNFALLNTRSLCNKTLQVKDYVVENDIDLLAITETWLLDQDSHTTRELCPTGYMLHSVPRGSRGGGVALLSKKALKVKNCSTAKRKFKSFEYVELSLNHLSTNLRIVIVYRPPPSSSNQSTVVLFFNEFPILLESLATASGSLLISGDFNLHVNDVCDTTVTRFLQLIESFNLKQHVCEPMHRSGHILDLLITRADESIASAVNVTDPCLSDHLAVRCFLSLPKTAFERKEIQYRKLKSVDISLFRSDLSNAFLKNSICHDTDVSLAVQEYNSILTGLLDKHAPVKKRVLTLRPNAAWYTDDIKQEKAKRRKLERRWRATRLTIDRQIYVEQCKHVSKCIYDAKRDIILV